MADPLFGALERETFRELMVRADGADLGRVDVRLDDVLDAVEADVWKDEPVVPDGGKGCLGRGLSKEKRLASR